LHAQFLGSLNHEDSRFRFFATLRQLPPTQLSRFTQIDYDGEMALIAVDESHPVPVLLGEVRAVFDPDNLSAEVGVVVRSDIKDMGLGTVLLRRWPTIAGPPQHPGAASRKTREQRAPTGARPCLWPRHEYPPRGRSGALAARVCAPLMTGPSGGSSATRYHASTEYSFKHGGNGSRIRYSQNSPLAREDDRQVIRRMGESRSCTRSGRIKG
jgi:hypothetical protein